MVAKRLLTESQKLRLQFPLALPKIHIELSRLLPDDALKLTELEDASNSCSEAREFLLNDDKPGASQRTLRLNTLKELHASALWDGYTLQKGHSAARAKSQRHALTNAFAPSHVASALQEVAYINRGNSAEASRFLGAQLRQASVFLDLLTSYSSTAGELCDTVQIERRFLQILDDDLKPRLAIINDKDSPLSTAANKATELEVVWIEWRMKTGLDENYNREGILEDQTHNAPIDRKHLRARLERLRGSRHMAHEDRVLLAIGYLYLSYGDYQKAIDALAEIEQNEEFAAQVILCLAHKDSGNFPAAKLALSKIMGAESGSTRELIKSFLEAELALAQGENSESIETLEDILTTPTVSRPQLLQEALQLNNEYQKAISILDASSETQSLPELKRVAIAKLKEHIKFEGAKQDVTPLFKSFIRVRAACALTSALLQHSDDAKQKSKELGTAIAKYEEELSRYNEALKEYNTAASSDHFSEVSEQFTLIEQGYADLVKLKDEFRELSGFNNEARSYCLQAIKELEGLREGNNNCSFRYPSLAYNTLCLAMRVFLLSPDREKTIFAAQLNNQGAKFSGMKEISEAARCIALQQRSKLSKEGVFDESRNKLFERYRDAFELSVELGTSGFVENLTVEDVAFISADTNNRTVSELLIGSQADTPVQSENLEFVSKDIMTGKRFLSFFVGSDATHVFWRIADDRVHHCKVNRSRSEIADNVQVYISDYLSRAPGSKVESDVLRRAFELQEALFSDELKSQLAAAAKSDSCVYVIPHGPLFQLPLDTLPTVVSAGQTEFVIDTCPPLVYLASFRLEEGQANTHLYRKSLLTVQPDSAVGRESIELVKLPFVSETLQIKPDRSTEPPRRSEGEQSFDPSKLLAELAQGYRLVHFGCHGGFKVVESGQLKSAPEQRDRRLNESGEEESESYLDGAFLELWKPDDVLTASDVLHHFSPSGDNRLNSELVFLSACETQVIDGEAIRYGGNTIKAMGTSFLVAGAENVIASHWKVDDVSTTQLVKNFMCAVSDSSKTRMNAEDYASLLHEKRKRLKKSEEFQDPYHWGAFTISTLQPHIQ